MTWKKKLKNTITSCFQKNRWVEYAKVKKIIKNTKNLKKEIKKQKKANLEDSDGVQMPCKLMFTGVKKCIDILQKHLKKQSTLVK